MRISTSADSFDFTFVAENKTVARAEVPQEESHYADALSHLFFNPQPEPPPPGYVSDLEARGFNPQPEPPADLDQAWDIIG